MQLYIQMDVSPCGSQARLSAVAFQSSGLEGGIEILVGRGGVNIINALISLNQWMAPVEEGFEWVWARAPDAERLRYACDHHRLSLPWAEDRLCDPATLFHLTGMEAGPWGETESTAESIGEALTVLREGRVT